MEGFYLALGITVVLPFGQWLAPTMPKPIAYTGMAGGILIMLSEFLDPSMKPPFAAVVLFLVGALCIGGAIQLYMKRMKEPSAPAVAATPSVPASMTAQPHVEPAQTEYERRQRLFGELRDKLVTSRPELVHNTDGALAWMNAQLEARGETFKFGKRAPSGMSNMTIIGNNKGGTFMRSEGAEVLNENLIIQGFGTAFDVKGGSMTNKNVKATAPDTKPPTEHK
jgi:hypothetical protein